MAAFETRFARYVPFGRRMLETTAPNLTGTDVAILQLLYNLMLEVMEPPHGKIGPVVDVDGVFGPRTRTAVLALQTYFGVTADGIAGPQTYGLLGHAAASDAVHPLGSRPLGPASAGGDVMALQMRLSCFSYGELLGRPGDGSYDKATAAAVKQFQGDAATLGQGGLRPSGIVKAATFNALWLYTFAGGRRLFVGRNGLDVVFMQAQLRSLGLYHGPLDGYFGQSLLAAARDLQRAAGLAPDSKVGAETFFALGKACAGKPPGPFPPIRS
jgi:peptidoglycan hydrolase-like protein with peptidoglycan-binding domain